MTSHTTAFTTLHNEIGIPVLQRQQSVNKSVARIPCSRFSHHILKSKSWTSRLPARTVNDQNWVLLPAEAELLINIDRRWIVNCKGKQVNIQNTLRGILCRSLKYKTKNTIRYKKTETDLMPQTSFWSWSRLCSHFRNYLPRLIHYSTFQICYFFSRTYIPSKTL